MRQSDMGAVAVGRKEELGHLLDSATNNRIRFALAAIHGEYTGPTYSPNSWVHLSGYRTMPWKEIVNHWVDCNRMLAALIANIPESRLPCFCHIGDGPEVTLQFLIDDYAVHLQHHLDHILGREAATSYPGASLDV